MKKKLLNSSSWFRLHIRIGGMEVRVALVVPAIVAAYLLAQWLSR
jgi:hypothetical protein